MIVVVKSGFPLFVKVLSLFSDEKDNFSKTMTFIVLLGDSRITLEATTQAFLFKCQIFHGMLPS